MSERRYGRGPHGHGHGHGGHHECDPEEFPPFSRLFILCDKAHTEADFRDRFNKFGNIEDLKVVKDRNTGDNKGVVYIKYSKTSEAAHALEDMNGKVIANSSRPIYVKVASSRQEGPVREDNEEKYLRLFVMTPRTMSDTDLREEFGAYGKVEYATIVKDKETRESKGFGYVKYKHFSEAASAFENADRKYKAIFAEPKKNKNHNSDAGYDMSYFPVPNMPTPEGYHALTVTCHPVCPQEQIRRLFDVVPGLDYFHYKLDQRRHQGSAHLVYTNHQAAKYARDKLNGFEYPPGSKLVVKPIVNSARGLPFGDQSPDFSTSPRKSFSDKTPDLAQLAETIAQATSIIQAAAAGAVGNKSDDSYCSVRLPPAKPLASIDAPIAQRCFIVCQPQPPPITFLRDAFSRFGNLIDVYTLRNKSVGYVKYATIESAEEARKVLHGAEICGVRMKVLEAEERRSNNSHSGDNHNESSHTEDMESNGTEHSDDRRKRMKIDS